MDRLPTHCSFQLALGESPQGEVTALVVALAPKAFDVSYKEYTGACFEAFVLEIGSGREKLGFEKSSNSCELAWLHFGYDCNSWSATVDRANHYAVIVVVAASSYRG